MIKGIPVRFKWSILSSLLMSLILMWPYDLGGHGKKNVNALCRINVFPKPGLFKLKSLLFLLVAH